ncbi:protein-glutamate methylesterase/protein-glutamine glutaminase [Oligoflexus tunisiensis]|uniref:protein-glutamate methylesterase/protein-glutamine glutaminase n=1 Tax=Oligoflexus tunisiensis TaxID=708132 RepID=UPI000AB7F8F0|nr:chemotaxis response regulator protein-glutamate methylesterase [Oligoflexus tunisiensis]
MTRETEKKLVPAKPDCIMTALDGEAISFELQDDILIVVDVDGKSCALALKASTLTASQLTSALRRIEGFLKCDPGTWNSKILGTDQALAHLRELSPPQLRQAKVVGRAAQALLVIFYPGNNRLRLACVGDNAAPRPDPAPKKIKVLLVDDSLTIRKLLTKVLAADAAIEVVAALEDPCEVEAAIKRLAPDVITVDIHMPQITGVELVKRIMATQPLPIIMITSVGLDQGSLVLEALEAGAIDYIQKPSLQSLSALGPTIIEKIKTAATARVQTAARLSSYHRLPALSAGMNRNVIIAIGASTGGTEALKDLLLRLPEEIPPILIVQHIPPVFSEAFAKRLNEICPFEVKEAMDGDSVRPGRVLIAPGGKQMRLQSRGPLYSVSVTDEMPVNRHKPSVDVLFNSVAQTAGSRAFGVILTGMGADGAQGLLKMRQAGCHTIAQNEESCVVFGMPREAVRIGAAEHTAHLFEIPKVILEWMRQDPRSRFSS